MATHYSILAWRMPWTEKPVGYSPWCCKELDTTLQLNNNALTARQHGDDKTRTEGGLVGASGGHCLLSASLYLSGTSAGYHHRGTGSYFLQQQVNP